MQDSFFPKTRWSLIQGIRDGENEDLLEEWCQSYWLPIRKYICSRGYNLSDAEELAQSFFERLIGKSNHEILPAKLKGAFRAYLKKSLKNFLIDQWRERNRKSNVWGNSVGENFQEACEEFEDSPDVAFDKAWLLNLIHRALEILEEECRKKGKAREFKIVAPLLDNRFVASSQQEMASQLGMTDTAFRMMLSRIRQRFRQLVENEIRETTASREEFVEEVRYLMSIWS